MRSSPGGVQNGVVFREGTADHLRAKELPQSWFPRYFIIFIRRKSPGIIHVTYYWRHIVEEFAIGRSTLLYVDYGNPLRRAS